MSNLRCGYCGKEYDVQEDVLLLRSDMDSDLLICEHCVKVYSDAIESVMKNSRSESVITEMGLKPSDMKKHFDDYIINQERAKKIISVDIYNHYKRTFYNNKQDEIDRKKTYFSSI